MTREAFLKGEINSLKEELEQAENNAQLLDNQVSGLQEELSQLKAQNAQLIRSLPSRDVRYTHALKVIKDLLAERVRSMTFLFPLFFLYSMTRSFLPVSISGMYISPFAALWIEIQRG
jgi:predicted nuclease with TOPRIM domain